MEDLVLSCLESRVEENRNLYARFLVGPFLRGDALTVATALRRVLLSSIESIGVTALYIQGITHEFSTIVGVRESVLELSLNFQAVVLSYDKAFFQKKSFFDGVQIGYLQVQGPKVVYANHLKLPLGVKLVDPTQYIATVSKEGSIVLKFIIGKRNNCTHQNIGPESHFGNVASNLPVIGELVKKNIVRAKKTCSYKNGFTIKLLPTKSWVTDFQLASNRKQNLLYTHPFLGGMYKAKKGKSCTNVFLGSPSYKSLPLQILAAKPFTEGDPAPSPTVKGKDLYGAGSWIPFGPFRATKGILPHTNRRFVRATSYKSSICTKGFADKIYTCKAFAAKQKIQNLSNRLRGSSYSCKRTGQFPQAKKASHTNLRFVGFSTPLQVQSSAYKSTPFTVGDGAGSPFTGGDKVILPHTNLRFVRATSYKSSICTKGFLQIFDLYAKKNSLLLSFAGFSTKNLPLQIEDLYGSGSPPLPEGAGGFAAKKGFAAKVLPAKPRERICKKICTGCMRSIQVRTNLLTSTSTNRRFVRRFLLVCLALQKGLYARRWSPPFGESGARKGNIIPKKLNFLSKRSSVFKSSTCLRNVIPLDFTLTPVLKVNFVVEVDDEVLYLRQKIRERIILEVWTNGSIHPRQAVHDAALSLTDMFASFRSVYQNKSSSSSSSSLFCKQNKPEEII